MSNPFEICRHNLGEPPRHFSRARLRKLLLKAPQWSANSPLHVVAGEQKLLLEKGNVVHAAVVSSSVHLTEPGTSDAIALVLWTLDPHLENDLCRLQTLASELYHQLATDTSDVIKNSAQAVAQKHIGCFNQPLIENWQGEDGPFFVSELLVWRDHLPCRFLHSIIVPLLVLPEETNVAMILPGKFWSNELKDR